MNGWKGNTWLKIALVVLPLALAALIAGIRIDNEVGHLRAELQTKANRETVITQYDAILRELQSLRDDIKSLRRP